MPTCMHEGCAQESFLSIKLKWHKKGQRGETEVCEQHAPSYLQDLIRQLPQSNVGIGPLGLHVGDRLKNQEEYPGTLKVVLVDWGRGEVGIRPQMKPWPVGSHRIVLYHAGEIAPPDWEKLEDLCKMA